MASETLIIIGLGITVVALIGYIVRNERRLSLILQGPKAENLEDTLSHLTARIAKLEDEKREIVAHLGSVESRLVRSIQKVGTVRFNAFKDSGGGQSFATAFLDEKGDGVVLSTLYSRDRVSMFSKPIEKYVSSFTLTPEEDAAIIKAKQ